ncbi:glycosyltransferase family 4 protein [Candidatus Woesearchaeota archaeon]|nr:glycosyltransferase family 4 protein [Candidatus Woesearchaeota archaeon]
MDEQVKRKTLLIATDCFLPRWDGVSRFLYEVVPHLAKRFDVVIAAPRYPGKFEGFEDVTVLRFPVARWKVADINPAKVKRSQLIKLVKNSDVVWTQSIGPIGALAMYYANKHRKPLVSFVHSVEWFLFSKSLKRFREFVEFTIRKVIPFLYNKCDMIIVPFEGMIPLLEEQKIDSKKEVVYLGVDVRRFQPAESKILAKERVGLNPNNVVIGYLGRFGREKDVPTLYDAFRKLHAERPNTTLLLVGGELKEPFEDMEDVKVVGPVDNAVQYYQAMDIYVLPSLTETTSLTTMEAMACGLPVVVTPVGYVEKYVEHKRNGFVFPARNVDRLYILLRKLAKDLYLRKEVGKAARQAMMEKHTWERTADGIAKILERF